MERSSLPTSSNKVTVECLDPSGLFTTVKPLLLKHLPLRNLHWKSSNRPLRSIDTLHVDLVPAKNGSDGGSAPERRHQIPGLRQTPYVKVYLLRCDDNETYKTTCRKQIREWIKSNVPPGEGKKGSSSHESHDACEWLIVHIVLPDTAAAVPQRTSKDSQFGSTESSDSVTNKPKWPGKSATTVFEKLNADFNSSSRANIERVAQIRLPKADHQISADTKDQLSDLVEKLKVTILTSFDLRVRQYEEDIREKDNQRSLPGWNFNTFFILKEGLARGFENVGLFEDALVVYDELALGLEVIVDEQLDGGIADHGGRFLHFSDELKDKVLACLKDADEGDRANGHRTIDANADPAARLPRKDYPLDASKSPYRDLILANHVSIFDFRLYIFSRQLDLLLRSANALSTAEQLLKLQPNLLEQKEHFLPLAEACQRALDFITNGSRTLRHDVELALEVDEPELRGEKRIRVSVASNFVSSWVYVSSLQVLAQTGSPNLKLAGSAEGVDLQPPTRSLVRTTSPIQVNGPHPSPWPPARTPSPGKTARPLWPEKTRLTPAATKTGAEELAGARGELYLLARTTVRRIGGDRGWSACEGALKPVHATPEAASDLSDVPLEDQLADNSRETLKGPVINGLQCLDLRDAFHSEEAFREVFECLTMLSYRHFIAANRTNSAAKSLADLAILKYNAGEYEAAAAYLSGIASFYKDDGWQALEATFLELYADCLKRLGRHREYVTNLLRLLGHPDVHQQRRPASAMNQYMTDLWEYSARLTTSVQAKLSDFFSIRELGPFIRHYKDKDGFFIALALSSRQSPVQVTDGLRLTASAVDESIMQRITLSSGPIKLQHEPRTVELGSNLSICGGWYSIEMLEIRIGNLVFIEDFKASRPSAVSHGQAKASASLRYFVYPPKRSLQATAAPAPSLHLTEPRKILIEMKTGWNDIRDCTMSMKSATAGLRIRLHEAKIKSDGGNQRWSSNDHVAGAQTICLAACPADTTHELLVPYTIDNVETPVINAKLDIEYTTAKGSFLYSSLIAVNTILPVSVNVQDIFNQHQLFSRFTISPATLVPLRIWACSIQDSGDGYTIESHTGLEGAIDVFPKQPASIIYRFNRRQSAGVSKGSNISLSLSVRFSCLDEVVLKVLENSFMTAISASPVAHLVQPFCLHLLSTFRSQWSAQDLEVIGLCHEIEIWPFEDLGWDALLMGFDVQTRGLARAWLKHWHQDNTVIPVYADPDELPHMPSRHIIIPVDIPSPPLVITASLELDSTPSLAVTLGHTLLAHLEISYTHHWAPPDFLSQDGKVEISFEVLTAAENWVIGGMRKGNFLATGEELSVHSVPIILLPQRTGHLLLPSIDVQCHRLRAGKDKSLPGKEEGNKVHCEVDVRSLSRSVHVVSGFRETVVKVEVEGDAQAAATGGERASGAEKRSWLVAYKGVGTEGC